tara:strand:- start:1350 stop:1847 length:498 start_codon:yes stop_codon:yes gene_type:complete
MHFLKLIIFIIGILNITNISKADNFLGNCNIGNEREHLNTAFKLMDKFNFKTNMSKEKLIYCEYITNFSNRYLFFSMVPYQVYWKRDERGGYAQSYIQITELYSTACIEFFILESFVVDKYIKKNKLRIMLNPETGNYDLHSKWAYTKLFTENCPKTNKRYFDKN